MLRFLKPSRAKSTDDALPPPDLSRIFPERRQTSPAPQAPESAARAPAESDFLPHDWLQKDLCALRAALSGAVAAPSKANLHALFLCAHNLKGAAAPLGHPAVSRIAASLCRILEARGEDAPDDPLTRLHIDAIAAAANGGASAERLADAVCVALEDRVSAVLR